MPATEQTWRNLKTLHVVFGVSALVMLLVSIWMLAADHNREAKSLQKQFNRIETQYLEWRSKEQLTSNYLAKKTELEKKLTEARAEVPSQEAIDAFLALAEQRPEHNYKLDAVEKSYAELKTAGESYSAAKSKADEARAALAKLEAENADDAKKNEQRNAVDAADNDATAAAAAVAERRNALFSAMQTVVAQATFVENESQRKLKFTKADLDVDMSMLAIGVDEGKSPEELQKIQGKVSQVRSEVDEKLTRTYQENKAHRVALQDQLAAIRNDESLAQKELEKHDSDVDRLNTAISEKSPNALKRLAELPIIDAFGGPLKPQQVWLPDLPWNNNFRNVARFDRCVTCHQGIDKTAPGSAVDPAYPVAVDTPVQLDTPKVEPSVEEYTKELNERLKNLYGMILADRGLFNPDEITIEAVYPGGAAIRAGLRSGDVIVKASGVSLLDKQMAENYLASQVAWGKPLELVIRRGVPEPYSSHPRLDLFVGSMSPHKVGEFGCTICHEGQGNGTAFKWASHTPNDPLQADAWKREHGWFNNHHWIYPMLPKRFDEANCLKCHHELTELKPSKRFPDPPAPRLVAGYELIESVGCFGCHEINGYDGPKKRRGPDLRAEPNFFAAAAQVAADPKLQGALEGELARIADLAKQVTQHPEQTAQRKLLAELIERQVQPGTDGKPKSTLSSATIAMAGMLGADDETPGKYPKVGPSLRYTAAKNDLNFLYSWIKNPKNFRPTTKMPQFFGLHKHLVDVEKLDDNGKVVLDEHGHPVMTKSAGKVDAERFEPIEVTAISKYLLGESQPFQYVEAKSTTDDGKKIEAASVERGKFLFETRGCLACHSHKDFTNIHGETFTAKNDGKPAMSLTQGPDLSGLGAKLTGKRGEQWLYSWLKQPNQYHPRTVMPNLLLDPVTDSVIKDGQVASTTTYDPAADITAYLLSQKAPVDNDAPWQAEAVPAYKSSDVDDLLKTYLLGAFSKADAERVVKEGVPAAERSSVKGDEVLLVVEEGQTWNDEKKLLYLGKKSIGRLGCAGCHDIPGFEDAKPIGTGLADWGRKEPSKLAFEQILAYLATGKGGHGHGDAATTGPRNYDEEFFVEAIGHHQREGFIWQKLREPRSYDYKKTENKSYIDRLRMPQFNLTEDQREAIMTFVLGLVAEPPPAKYIYTPNAQQQAILSGAKVIEKFNCAGCHTFEMQRWDVDYVPGKPKAPDISGEYDFLIPHYTPQQIAKSKAVDRRGFGHAVLHGLPEPKEEEEEPTVYFKLWSSTLVDGQTWLSGGTSFEVDEKINPPGKAIRRPQVGGVFANYLHPVALADEKKRNPAVKASDAWGFVPPPLMGEGAKVQTRWLHDFLLEPFQIRPAAILRMPKFHMTSAEADAIVHHFAAVDGVDYPYEFDVRRQADYLAASNASYMTQKREAQRTATPPPPPAPGATPTPPSVPSGDRDRLNDALALVTDNGFCVKCHLVGDFRPTGAAAGLGPNLSGVSARLRPDYLKRWIANPARILPYTGMPVNFPKTQTVAQDLYKGTSEQQIDAVVDLLLNYDAVIGERTKIVDLMKSFAAANATGTPTSPSAPSAGTPAAAGSAPSSAGGSNPSPATERPKAPSPAPTPSTATPDAAPMGGGN